MKNKFNTQICTTIEQSKRLLELGSDADTSDMCWLAKKLWGDDVEIPEEDRSYILSTDKDDSFCNRYDVDCVPAWSLHRLIAMLPFKTNLNSDTSRRIRILPSTDNNFIIVYKEYKVMEKLSLYDSIISIIEEVIKDGYFNKEYLKED